MASFGEKLRRAREDQGRELSQIAAEIRIDGRYLAAIEADDLDKLPGGFFTRSFVRQYAAALGFPASEVAAVIEELAASQQAPYVPGQEPPRAGSDLAPLSDAVGVPRRPRRRILGAFLILVAVIAACAGLYGLWLKSQDGSWLARVSGRQTRPPAETSAPVRPAPVVSKPLRREIPMPSEAAAPARPEGETLAGPLWFRLDATEETWVRVMSGGRRLFTGTLQPGETRRFSGLERATLRIGNAGGLEILANGKLVGPIGPRGQIRVVTLTPEKAEISVPARREPSSEPEEAPAGPDSA